MAGVHKGRLDSLWRERFAEVPLDCGRATAPGVDEVEEWRHWHERDTTSDQQRIEDHLARSDVRGRHILHVGVGNSKLAVRFSGEAAYILGTTISINEKRHGESLALPNYDVSLHNKYATERVRGRVPQYDFIVDNNPTTFCCCWRHLTIMMDHYVAMLKPKGRVLTDKVGLGWVVSADEANQRWRFTYEDLRALGEACGLEARRETDFVYSLSPMSRPEAVRRRIRRLGGRILRRWRRRA